MTVTTMQIIYEMHDVSSDFTSYNVIGRYLTKAENVIDEVKNATTPTAIRDEAVRTMTKWFLLKSSASQTRRDIGRYPEFAQEQIDAAWTEVKMFLKMIGADVIFDNKLRLPPVILKGYVFNNETYDADFQIWMEGTT